MFTNTHMVFFHFVVQRDNGCFPSKSKVKLENGDIVTMSELQKGDKVQTGNKKSLKVLKFNLCDL